MWNLLCSSMLGACDRAMPWKDVIARRRLVGAKGTAPFPSATSAFSSWSNISSDSRAMPSVGSRAMSSRSNGLSSQQCIAVSMSAPIPFHLDFPCKPWCNQCIDTSSCFRCIAWHACATTWLNVTKANPTLPLNLRNVAHTMNSFSIYNGTSNTNSHMTYNVHNNDTDTNTRQDIPSQYRTLVQHNHPTYAWNCKSFVCVKHHVHIKWILPTSPSDCQSNLLHLPGTNCLVTFTHLMPEVRSHFLHISLFSTNDDFEIATNLSSSDLFLVGRTPMQHKTLTCCNLNQETCHLWWHMWHRAHPSCGRA